MLIKNNFSQSVLNIADKIIAIFSRNRVWFFILALWTIATMFTTESKAVSWEIFLSVFGFLIMVFSPALLFTLFRNQLITRVSKLVFYLINSLVFIIYPTVLLLTNAPNFLNSLGVFAFHQAVYDNDLVVFYLIFYIGLLFILIEIFLNFGSFWTIEWKFLKRIKNLNLEQALLATMLFFAVLISLINLFSDDELPNNLIGLPLFFVKWFFFSIQLYLIMFIYYLFYWINHYVLINKVLRQKGMLIYAASFMFVVMLLYPVAAKLTFWIASIPYFGMEVFVREGSFHGTNFLFPFMEMLISIPFILAIQWSKQSKEIANLEKQKSDAELNLLKQQINPHFFFNTLNNLYALSLKKDEATPEVILQLSELMRYVIYKGKEKTVLLKEEIKYIEDYCELQQIRLYKTIDFQFNKNIENENLQIPPLLFIILIENAFKHGIEPAEKACFLHIDLITTENYLTFICENSIEGNTKEKSLGIGLENLKQRLNLRFPNQHELIISETEKTYKVELRMTKDERRMTR